MVVRFFTVLGEGAAEELRSSAFSDGAKWSSSSFSSSESVSRSAEGTTPPRMTCLSDCTFFSSLRLRFEWSGEVGASADPFVNVLTGRTTRVCGSGGGSGLALNV